MRSNPLRHPDTRESRPGRRPECSPQAPFDRVRDPSQVLALHQRVGRKREDAPGHTIAVGTSDVRGKIGLDSWDAWHGFRVGGRDSKSKLAEAQEHTLAKL